MSFQAAWEHLLGIEQLYSNHPADPGGATMYGITEKVARAHGYAGRMEDMPVSFARRVAKVEYWDPLRLDSVDQVAPAVALELLDISYNMWHGAAGKFLQRALNALQGAELELDGQVGPKTLAALYGYLQRRGAIGEPVLLRMLNAQQCVDYMRQCEETPSKRAFIFGWVRQRVRV